MKTDENLAFRAIWGNLKGDWSSTTMGREVLLHSSGFLNIQSLSYQDPEKVVLKGPRYFQDSILTRRTRPRALRVERLEPRSLLDAMPVISELMAANKGGLLDEDHEASDWIEIHNRSADELDLSGWHLTDDLTNGQKWTFPNGLRLAADAYLVVFASGKDRTDDFDQLHTNFKLDADGEFLRLSNSAGSVIDALSPYPQQVPGFSYGISNTELLGYFDDPTPGEANAVSLQGIVSDMIFSRARGFYQPEDSFDLTIRTPTLGASIYYTLDGSLPDASNPSATLYSSQSRPHIENTTILRAAAFKHGYVPSQVDTQTYIFLDDVVLQNGTPAGWPTGSVNGQVFDFGMDPEIVTHTEWGPQITEALTQVPTLSLVTDLDNLVDPTTGIYVNADLHGADWERDTSFELIYPDGTDGFQIDAGLRIRGGFSRRDFNPKHAFRLFFREEYGDGKLNYPLFGEEGVDQFDKIDLRTTQNDSWAYQASRENTMINDVFSRDTQGDMGHAYTRSRYYHLYINGLYWGLFQTQERPEASFGASYFGGDRDDYDTIKSTGSSGGYKTEATDGNLDAWRELWDAVRAGVEDDADYLQLQGLNPDGSRNESYPVLLDVDNLIDYMTIIIATGNEDAPLSKPFGDNKSNNWYGVRNRNGDEGFRFFMHDAEQTFFSNHNVGGLYADRVGPFVDANQSNFLYSNPQWIHQDLMVNETYRRRFGDRVHQHMMNDGLLTPDAIKQAFLDRAAEIDVAIIAESARWGDETSSIPLDKDDWEAALERIFSEFLPYRNDIVFEQLRTAKRPDGLGGLVAAPLYPSVAAPVFSQHGGPVEFGFALTITATPKGSLYYTLDGSDPRGTGSAVSESAILYDGTPISLTQSRTLRTALLDGGEWSALNQASFTVDLPIHITEIMYNPAEPTAEEIAGGFTDNDAFEFIEIMNFGPEPIALQGMQFTDGINFVLPDIMAQPGERYIIARSEAAFLLRYGDEATLLGEYDGSLIGDGPHKLSNGGERVALAEAIGSGQEFNTFEQFTYDDQWYPSTDGQGYSLVVIDPAAASLSLDEASDWTSSYLLNGSPGGEDLLAGDLDGNHQTDLRDLGALTAGMGTESGASRAAGDLNYDSMVDRSDLVAMLAGFGRSAQSQPATANSTIQSSPAPVMIVQEAPVKRSAQRHRKPQGPRIKGLAADQALADSFGGSAEENDTPRRRRRDRAILRARRHRHDDAVFVEII